MFSLRKKIFYGIILCGGLSLFAACGNLSGSSDPVVVSVAVSPSNTSVARGGTRQFSASVTGVNNPSQAVTWSIVQTDKASGTGINGQGLLTVAADEILGELTVRAASAFDNTKYGLANVTVEVDGEHMPAVSVVTVSPATPGVAKGGTQRFSATVTGVNNPSQAVTWSVAGGVTGTGISAEGVLTVAADESAASLTVTATSTVDTSKSGTATV
jgi:uncharacterized protein YjdB